jgi:hypothetical protein
MFCAEPPAAVVVQGDTNTVAAGSQAASYAGARGARRGRPALLRPRDTRRSTGASPGCWPTCTARRPRRPPPT